MERTEPDTTGVTLDQIDLTDLDRFAESFPHEWFSVLRREAPVWWHEPTANTPGGVGFWVVTKYADVVAVSRDYETYSSERGPDPDAGGGIAISDSPPEFGVGTMMLMMDPPQHTRYRNIVSTAFTPKAVRLFEQQVRRRTREIVDAVAERGECDFVTDVAAELPLQAIAEIVGVDQEDRGRLFDWTNRMIGSQDPEYATDPDAEAGEAMAASAELFAYADALAKRRREDPGTDIFSAIVTAEVDGERLDDMEIDLFFMLLTVAGNETTRNAITHGLRAFFEFPEQWQLLRERPDLLDSAVEEIVRYASPVVYFRRTAKHDAELRGHRVRAGDKVTIWYPSANRDEDVFDDPFTFDIRRSPNPHIGFGGRGPHFCLGANLARLEIKVMFEELVTRLPDLAPAGEPSRLRMNLINGIKHLPVTFTPTAPLGVA